MYDCISFFSSLMITWMTLSLLEGAPFQISNYLLIHPGGWNFRIFTWLYRLGNARQLYLSSQGKRLNSCFELMPCKSLSSVFVLRIQIWLQLVTVQDRYKLVRVIQRLIQTQIMSFPWVNSILKTLDKSLTAVRKFISHMGDKILAY